MFSKSNILWSSHSVWLTHTLPGPAVTPHCACLSVYHILLLESSPVINDIIRWCIHWFLRNNKLVILIFYHVKWIVNHMKICIILQNALHKIAVCKSLCPHKLKKLTVSQHLNRFHSIFSYKLTNSYLQFHHDYKYYDTFCCFIVYISNFSWCFRVTQTTA